MYNTEKTRVPSLEEGEYGGGGGGGSRTEKVIEEAQEELLKTLTPEETD